MSPGGRLNAYIPEELHIQLKIRAAKERKSLSEIVVQAIKEYLEKPIPELKG